MYTMNQKINIGTNNLIIMTGQKIANIVIAIMNINIIKEIKKAAFLFLIKQSNKYI